MKLILSLLAFVSISAFAQEVHTVTGKKLYKSILSSGNPTVAEAGGGNGINVGGTSGGGGGEGLSAWGNKTACQTCQSDTELYSCKVSVLATVKETYDKTFSRLSQQNCCKDKGGRVLATVPTGC